MTSAHVVGPKFLHGCFLASCLALLFHPCLASKSGLGSEESSKQVCRPLHSPTEFYLSQNYPNPFQPWTCISFGIPAWDKQLPAKIAIYSRNGSLIKTLFSGFKAPGNYSLVWDGRDEKGRMAPGGTYLYRIRVGHEFHEVKTMTLREPNPVSQP